MKPLLKRWKIMVAVSLYLSIIVGCSQQQQSKQQVADLTMENGWVDLFDGKSFEGWELKGGSNQFAVEDNMIVSTAVWGKKGVFLCTTRNYDNFILEWEVKIDTNFNSGVQIRSQIWEQDTTTKYLNGRGELEQYHWEAGSVWGYQIDVDPSPTRWSGGLYELGNRGWLVNLSDNHEAREAFDHMGWNKMKVEINGNRIKTWVNDVPAINTTDDLLVSGFIALQHHKANNERQHGKKVYWKNIRIKEL